MSRNVLSVQQVILGHLVDASPSFVSGQALARMRNVSRASVWKAISKLRKAGYPIEGSPRLGYRLVSPPDLLEWNGLRPFLKTKDMGRKGYHHFRELPSTNDHAKILARQGAPHGSIVVAEGQSAGRGRLGRTWHSPSGSGLYFSLILRPNFAPSLAPRVTLLAGVGVCRAIRTTSGQDARIKWPNDVLVRQKKVAGILMEMEAEAEAIHYMVLGIGVNVNSRREELPEELNATSLFLETGRSLSRTSLLAEILLQVELLWEELINQGFDPVARAWRDLSETLEQWVRIESPCGSVTGRATDIDDQGALLVVDSEGRTHRATYGDVIHVRSIY